MPENLLSIPPQAGRVIIETGSVIACRPLGTDRFVNFCKERGLEVDRDRLLRLERLGLFAPIFRVRDPEENVAAFSIPIRDGRNWFDAGWAWDTTSVASSHYIPDLVDRALEGYYSIFQIDHLSVVLSSIALQLDLDSYLDSGAARHVNWEKSGRRWLKYAEKTKASLQVHQHRRSKALLCQFISDRYYPQTQGDMRTIQISTGHYSDRWIRIYAPDWDWYRFARSWDPRATERFFHLTPEKLRNAYEGLALSQAQCDPLAGC